MKKLLTVFTAIVLLASCQKEIGLDPNSPAGIGSGSGTGSTGNGSNSGGSTGSGLLVKTVAVSGTETQTTLYGYDAQKRLETITLSGTSGGLSVDSYQKFVRDGAGRIVKVLQKIADPPGATADTSVKTYRYPDATTLNFDYSFQEQHVTMSGIDMGTVDSCVYTYTSGRMASYRDYMFSSLLPGTVQMNSRWDFTYDASNRVTGMKVYNDAGNPGGPLTLFADYVHTYSLTTVNGLYASASGAQNFALNGSPGTGAGILTKTVITSSATNVTLTFTFVAGTGNKPTSGTSTAVVSGQPNQTTNYTFYYQ